MTPMPEFLPEEIKNWRAHTWAAAKNTPPRRPSFDRPGLEMMVGWAAQALRDECPEVGLPWNLEAHGPYVGERREGAVHCSREERDEMVGAAGRFAGWLRAVSGLPGLRLLLRQTQSGRGVNSPRTKMDLWRFAARFPSPHRAERVFWRVKRRAEAILRPWGLRPSWSALGVALAGYGHSRSRRVGRMALAVAADTVGEYAGRRGILPGCRLRPRDFLVKMRGLSEALALDEGKRGFCSLVVTTGEAADLREAVRLSERLVYDETDGVKAWLDPEARVSRHGITAALAFETSGGRAEWVVSGHGRTYHYGGIKGAVGAIRAALAAWRSQRVAERAEALVNRRLFPSDRTVLVYRRDSIAAGNCSAGTDAFIERRFPGREVVPAEWLVDEDSPSVRRVLSAVAAAM